MKRAICPSCWHDETMRARLNQRERLHDDPQLMSWYAPRGAGGQQVTPMSGGVWHCNACGVTLPPSAAGVLLDAALMASDPHCDSIDSTGVHTDVYVALAEKRNRRVEP